MAEQPKTNTKNQAVHPPQEPPKAIWIDNDDTNESSQKQEPEIDEEFKKEHQQYLSARLKRWEQERKLKIEQFGQSSSDEEITNGAPSFNTQNKQAQEVKVLIKQEIPSAENADSGISKSASKAKSIQKVDSVDNLQILTNSKKGSTAWTEEKIRITEKIVQFPSFECPYYDMNKLKLIFSDIGDRCYKLKINWKNEEFLFGASYQKMHKDLPQCFYIFARIISLKLSLMGRKPQGHLQLKNQGIPEAITKNAHIYGKILKKSRVISRWSDIFVVINNEGLEYFKKMNEKGDLLVPRTSITELWTRFEFQNQYLIVKLFQDGTKIQLGIPIQDELSGKGWLYHLYKLVFK